MDEQVAPISEEERWALEDELVAAAGQANAAVAAMVLVVERVLLTRSWEGWGLRSAAHWLSWKCGVSPARSRALVRVARRLRELPLTREAFEAGRLSESAAIAITRVGTAENEATLLDYARNGTITQLEKICSTYQRILTDDERARLDALGPKRRYLDFFPDELDDSIRISGRFDFEDGEIIRTALEAQLERLYEQRRAEQAAGDAENAAQTEQAATDGEHADEGDDEAADNDADDEQADDAGAGDDRQAVSDEWGAGFDPDAAHHDHDRTHHEPDHADTATNPEPGGTGPTGGTGPGTPADPSPGPQPPPVGLGDALVALARQGLTSERTADGKLPDRFQCVIHIRLKDLIDHTALDDAFWARDGTAITADLARMIACDSPRRLLLEHDGLPLDIGRATQSIPPHLRRGLEARDRHRCRWPECSARRRLHAHHVIFWADGGPTTLDNLILLCPWHHRLVHVDRFQIRHAHRRGEFTFHRPPGGSITTSGRPPGVAPADFQPHPGIDHSTAASGWAGDHLDLDLAIHVLLQADGRLRDPTPQPTAA